MTLRIIAGKYKGRLLKTPKSSSTRPTQGMLREAVFNICQHQVEGSRFLDLYAGSGAMGLEALSRGALHATFVENNRQALRCIEENIALLAVEAQSTLISLDVRTALKRLKTPFDLVYIDPPYDSPIGLLLEQIVSQNLLTPNAVLFVEERYDPKHQLPQFQSPRLLLQDSRRFGTALIHRYCLS